MNDADNRGAALDAACLAAHGDVAEAANPKTLLVVYYGAVGHELLLMGARLGYAISLLEPDDARRADAVQRIPGLVTGARLDDMPEPDEHADIVVSDHHRDDLGPALRDVLGTRARWIGLMGTPRHAGPHVEALGALGVTASDIARVHRPIGLNIGSRTPPEIAIATLAGLIADRAGRPGGFEFG
jgi:xanthine/CO dehydrogenase XdhC/CoxF family maturation factor